MNKHIEYFENIKKQCKDCKGCKCLHKTSLLQEITYGKLASLLVSSNAFEKQLKDTIFGCDQCGYCLRKCPMQFDAKEFMFHARGYIEDCNDQEKCKYNNVRVDRETNVFTKLQSAMNTNYQDALKEDQKCPRLFLPSCHMTAKFPALTSKSVTYLKKLDIIDGMTAMCCGHPLYAAGLYQEFSEYAKVFDDLLICHSVQSIITPCPNCYAFCYRLQGMGYLQNIEIQCLSEILVEKNIKVDASKHSDLQTISIHDSCPDRKKGCFGNSIRKLFEDFNIVELPHHQENTICCGCGGLVPPYSPLIAKNGINEKVKDYQEVNTDTVITTCFNCFDSLHSYLPIHHYLELLVEKADYKTYLEYK